MKKYIDSLYRLLKILINLTLKGDLNPTIKKIKIDSVDSCYIFGNGPSLIDSIKDKVEHLRHQTIFVVNDFALSDFYEKFQPGFYVLLHEGYWNNEVTNSDVVIKAKMTVDAILRKTDWPVNILVPLNAEKKLKQVFRKNGNVQIYSFSDHAFEGNTKISHMAYSNFWAAPLLQNVIIAAIFITINWGFEEINILGADHSWTEEIRVNKKNEVCLLDKHFYDDELGEAKLQPLEKVYRRKYTMHELLIDLAKMFHGYHVLDKYSKKKKVKIFNCTKNSYIDAFERKVL